MKKIYLQKTLFLILFSCSNLIFAQDTNKIKEIDGKLMTNGHLKANLLNSNNYAAGRIANSMLAPSITPASQTICTGSAITNITASTPAISDSVLLDCLTGGAGTGIDVPNNGIYFDILNSGATPLRVSGFTLVMYTFVGTATNTVVPFTIYKTTTAITAVGNYTTAANWTNLGNFNVTFAPTAMNSGWSFDSELNDNGFTLAPGASTGIYIVATTATGGFKLGYRTSGTTGLPIANADMTVTHRVRGTGLFTTDNVVRGFYGNVLYHKGTYGFWTRNNTTNITGTTTAGDPASGATPFPISGTLTNTNLTASETTTYTVTSYDVNGVKDVQTATVTVDPIPINTVSVAGGLATADQAGAAYQWFDCNNANAPVPGETNQSFNPTVDGNYGVTITLGACTINSGCTAVLSTNQFELNNSFVLYPNPSKNNFNIKSEYDFNFSIVNQLGQVVKKFNVAAGLESKVHTEGLPSGIYILSGVNNEGKKANKKIIIN